MENLFPINNDFYIFKEITLDNVDSPLIYCNHLLGLIATKYDLTPLWYVVDCASNKNHDLTITSMKLLLDHGANPNWEFQGKSMLEELLTRNFNAQRLEIAQILIDYGATFKCAHMIPQHVCQYIDDFIAQRNECRKCAHLVMGIHKFRISSFCSDVARLVGKHIWSLRMVEK